MLRQPTFDLPHELRLSGMAQAFKEQTAMPDISEFSFDDRLSLLLECEKTDREQCRYVRPRTAPQQHSPHHCQRHFDETALRLDEVRLNTLNSNPHPPPSAPRDLRSFDGDRHRAWNLRSAWRNRWSAWPEWEPSPAKATLDVLGARRPMRKSPSLWAQCRGMTVFSLTS